MKIAHLDTDTLNRPFLIAEAGSSHQGDAYAALEMTEVAIQSGADAFTFQEIDETWLYTHLSELPVDPQARVGWECLRECAQRARAANLCFSICVTDAHSLSKALEIGIDFIKIVSYDITYYPLLKQFSATGVPIFLSTGASTFWEIEKALLELNAPERTLLYHTDCGYPTPDEEINLMRMVKLKERFSLPVGYCDHTNHGLSCLAATVLKAAVIEKHFTLKRSLGGADHMVAMEPKELNELFMSIKSTAKMIGTGEDIIAEGDKYRRNNLRRSIALSHKMSEGEILCEDDLIMLRPPTGLSWNERYKLIGKKLRTSLPFRHILSLEDVE